MCSERIVATVGALLCTAFQIAVVADRCPPFWLRIRRNRSASPRSSNVSDVSLPPCSGSRHRMQYAGGRPARGRSRMDAIRLPECCGPFGGLPWACTHPLICGYVLPTVSVLSTELGLLSTLIVPATLDLLLRGVSDGTRTRLPERGRTELPAETGR